MRKIIAICAAASAAVLFTFAVAIAIVAVASKKLDLESHQYADASILAVVARWDTGALMTRASAQLGASPESANEIRNVFSGFRILGQLTKYDGSYGSAQFIVKPNGDAVAMAEYVARAEFQNGPAGIRVTLIRIGDGWKILRFAVSPIISIDRLNPKHAA